MIILRVVTRSMQPRHYSVLLNLAKIWVCLKVFNVVWLPVWGSYIKWLEWYYEYLGVMVCSLPTLHTGLILEFNHQHSSHSSVKQLQFLHCWDRGVPGGLELHFLIVLSRLELSGIAQVRDSRHPPRFCMTYGMIVSVVTSTYIGDHPMQCSGRFCPGVGSRYQETVKTTLDTSRLGSAIELLQS